MSKSSYHTHSFCVFREKHTVLSRLYWHHRLGDSAVQELISKAPGTDSLLQHVRVDFDGMRLPDTVDDYVSFKDMRCGVERLHLLTVCSANLEAYVQDATKIFLAYHGYEKGPNCLTEVGKATGSPVLNKSNVPEMLKYIESLLQISFGDRISTWKRAYKLRCAAAHNGGIVSPKETKLLSELGLSLGDHIKLSWDELNEFFGVADEIVKKIDKKISKRGLRIIEAKWLCYRLKDEKLLPGEKDLWDFLCDCGIHIPKLSVEEFKKDLYTP